MIGALTVLAGAAAPGDVSLSPGQQARLDLNRDGAPDDLLWVDRPSATWVSEAGWVLVDGATRSTVAEFAGATLIIRASEAAGWPTIEVLAVLPSVYEHRLYTYAASPTYTLVRSAEPTAAEADAIGAVPPAPPIPSLCDTARLVFGCEAATGKMVSVCEAPGGPEYRFGRPGAPELTILGGTLSTEDSPTRSWSAVTFANDGVTYQVTERWDLVPGSKQRTRAACGVRVSRGAEVLADLSCGPNVFGTLGAL